MTSVQTSLQKPSVDSSMLSTCCEMPQVVRTSGCAHSPLPSSGYAAIAAHMWPGMSISGTTVTRRRAAKATTRRMSSCV